MCSTDRISANWDLMSRFENALRGQKQYNLSLNELQQRNSEFYEIVTFVFARTH